MERTALVTVTKADEAAQLLPFKQTNYATDDQSVSWVRQYLLGVLNNARTERGPLEETWREIRRLVLLEHDSNQKYIGRSKVYVPSYLRARETLVSQLSRSLFPSDEYMDVKQRLDGKLENADGAKNYIKYEFEKSARLRATIKPFLSQFVDYGITVAKGFYHKPASRLRARLRAGNGGPLIDKYSSTSREGLRFLPRSMFYVYVWPATIDDLDEAEVVFEDIDVPMMQVDLLKRTGRWVNTEHLQGNIIGEHEDNRDQQLMETMRAVPQRNVGGGPFGTSTTVTECWLCMPLPRSAYEDEEEPGMPVPVKVVVSGDTVLEITRNPFWHQRSPYYAHRMRTFPGAFYPTGTGHAARFLQYLINDFTNQMNDNGIYALNPIVKANLALIQGPLPAFRPGVVIPTTDPKSIEFDRPPVEQLQYASMLVSLYMNMLQDTNGAPSTLQGTKGAKTATTTQILQANAMNPIQDMVEDIEASTMVRLMEDAIGFGQQFRTQAVLDELAGGPIHVTPNDLAGDFTYRYLASSQAANQQQRAQQALTLLQIIPGLQPSLMQNGKIADPEPLLRRIFSDGFGFRGFEEFIKAAPPPPQQPGAPGGPGPQAGPSAEETSGNAAMSANPGAEPVPGEEGAFAGVRDNADQMAAAAGAAQAGEPPPVFDTSF